MGRRRDAGIGEIAGLIAGLALMLGLLDPQSRKEISALASSMILLVGLFILGLAALALLYWFTRPKKIPPILLSGHTLHLSLPPDQPPPPKPYTCRELAHKLRSVDWFQFEKIVALAYRKQGFTVSRRGGANPDGGIDLVVAKDGETRAIQCKQWKTWKVGVKTVREMIGAMTDAQIKHGAIITLCGSTYAAHALAAKHSIEMLTEDNLVNLLERARAASDPDVIAMMEDTRKFCPKCERQMLLRTARATGSRFWGCSGYPRCRFTMPASS